MRNDRRQWTAPTLQVLDVKETYTGQAPGFSESANFYNLNSGGQLRSVDS